MKELDQLIIDGRIEQFIKEFALIVDDDRKTLLKLILSQYKEVENKLNLGVIDDEIYNVRTNRIRFTLLQMFSAQDQKPSLIKKSFKVDIETIAVYIKVFRTGEIFQIQVNPNVKIRELKKDLLGLLKIDYDNLFFANEVNLNLCKIEMIDNDEFEFDESLNINYRVLEENSSFLQNSVTENDTLFVKFILRDNGVYSITTQDL